LLLHCGKEELLVGVTVEGKTEQGGADHSDLFGYIGWIGRRPFDLILQQKALDLVVIDADGNDDDGERVIASGEAAAYFLGGTVQAANGEKSIDASDDQESEKPAEGNEEETAELFGMPLGFRVGFARRSRKSGVGAFGKSWHVLKNKTKLGEKRGTKARQPEGRLRGLACQDVRPKRR
jgi:hypothetical protein